MAMNLNYQAMYNGVRKMPQLDAHVLMRAARDKLQSLGHGSRKRALRGLIDEFGGASINLRSIRTFIEKATEDDVKGLQAIEAACAERVKGKATK